MPLQNKTGIFVITEEQNIDFANLSGDFNPLHIDPVYSRRLQFGRPVIHGVHHLLRTWDEILSLSKTFHPGGIELISATFPNPASVGQQIKYTYSPPDVDGIANISASCSNKTILTLRLKFSNDKQNIYFTIKNEFPPRETPIDQTFPPLHNGGECELYLDSEIYKTLFPNLFNNLPPSIIAQIISCTRVVGMKCPGMHSIFSRINLKFSFEKSTSYDSKLNYFEDYKDARVQIMKIGVHSSNMEGKLDTFFRPTPFSQPRYTEICQKVLKNEFSHQHALIIGGSRGVGETTAKILAAGGADVIVTYNKGLKEALAIQDEINQNSPRGRCKIMQFDTCDTASMTEQLSDCQPTHIYFFASPHIQANKSQQWDNEIFQTFCRFYLEAFSSLVRTFSKIKLDDGNNITFFYPSTVYIDSAEKGFMEYIVSKAAGETLCNQFAETFKNFKFQTPRLPRMSTDQTSSIIPIKSESTFDVMYRILQSE